MNNKNEEIVQEPKFNFNPETINPLTNKKIESYYINNETFEERFTINSQIVDECLSQGISLFLGFNQSIQRIFLVNDVDYKNIIYTMWFLFLRKGVLAILTYNAKTNEWANSSYQAAYIFLQYILKNQKDEEKMVKLEYTEIEEEIKKEIPKEEIKKEISKEEIKKEISKEEIKKEISKEEIKKEIPKEEIKKEEEIKTQKEDDKKEEVKNVKNEKISNKYEIELNLDKDMILCYGQEFISKFINQFHIWKCIGDVKSATEFINKYSEVSEKDKNLKKQHLPEKLYLYSNIIKEKDDSYRVKQYPDQLEGIIQSYIDRYGNDYNKDIYDQWVKYATSFIKI